MPLDFTELPRCPLYLCGELPHSPQRHREHREPSQTIRRLIPSLSKRTLKLIRRPRRMPLDFTERRFMGQAPLVDRFEQPRTHDPVDLDRRANNGFCQWISFDHWSSSVCSVPLW